MLACWASLPLERLAPSRNIRTGVPANCVDNLKQSSSYCGTVETGLKYKVCAQVFSVSSLSMDVFGSEKEASSMIEKQKKKKGRCVSLLGVASSTGFQVIAVVVASVFFDVQRQRQV